VFVGPKAPTDPGRVSVSSAPGLQTRSPTPSHADAPLGDEEDAIVRRRSRSRTAAVIFLCFSVGVILAATVLFKLGFLGAPQANTLDAQVARADEAMRHKRWDTPAGDNVRDLTDDGLARWPKDPRLLDIRERAADELVKEAVGRKFGGDLPAALHLAQVANELDPADTTAQHLVEDYQAPDKPSSATDNGAAVGADASVAPSHTPSARPGSVAAPTAKVAIDATPAHPHVGQPVGFVAKITNAAGGAPKSLEDVHFRLNGPGLTPDTRLTAVVDTPGTYRAAFTFFEAGKYDVTFEARVDGILVRAVRPIAAGEDAAPGASQAAPPPPAPSGKWL
jgi:serine/threonine-protein kinase